MANETATDLTIAGTCKDCGNGTMNNALVLAFDVDEETYTVRCIVCGSNHVDLLSI
jgi:hypothetical protein